MDKGNYLDSEQWKSVIIALEQSGWTQDRRIDLEPIFSVLETPPFPWKRFPIGEEAISRFHGIKVNYKLIPNGGITFYSLVENGGYISDCWVEQIGRMVLPLGRQDIEEIYIDDQGAIYKDFENAITPMGRDLQEGLYNLMFGHGGKRFTIECEEPDEIFEIYSKKIL